MHKTVLTRGVGLSKFDLVKFKDRLNLLREEKGLSLKDLASIFGDTNKSSLSNYINGITPIKVDMLAKIAEYFNVDIGYLIGEIDTRRNIQKYPPLLVEVTKEIEDIKDIPPEAEKAIKDILKLYLKFQDIK